MLSDEHITHLSKMANFYPKLAAVKDSKWKDLTDLLQPSKHTTVCACRLMPG